MAPPGNGIGPPAIVQGSPVRPWSRPLAVAFGFGRPRVGNRLIDGPLDLGVGEVLAGLGTLDDFGTGGIWGLKGAPRRTFVTNALSGIRARARRHSAVLHQRWCQPNSTGPWSSQWPSCG